MVTVYENTQWLAISHQQKTRLWVRCSNAIRLIDHLMIRLLSTLFILDSSGIQIPTLQNCYLQPLTAKKQLESLSDLLHFNTLCINVKRHEVIFQIEDSPKGILFSSPTNSDSWWASLTSMGLVEAGGRANSNPNMPIWKAWKNECKNFTPGKGTFLNDIKHMGGRG